MIYCDIIEYNTIGDREPAFQNNLKIHIIYRTVLELSVL